MKSKSFLNALLTLTLALVALNGGDAHAAKRRISSVDRCGSLGCSTVFLRNPSILALQLGLLNNRFGHGHHRGGSSYRGYGHGYGYFAALRLALIRNAYARMLAGKDFYRSNNPYPYLPVNTLLLQGEIGFLEPLGYASPNYKPGQVNLENAGAPANEARAVNPGDRIEKPAAATHGAGETPNAASGRPTVALANGVTPVVPVSSQQRESAETFPSKGKDWRHSILAQAVRDTGARSANGKKSDDLCARALSHSQNLATENSGRQGGFSVHHNGLPGGVFEIAAVVTGNTAAEAAANCVKSWQTSSDSRHPEYMNASFGEYCYAAVPVGTVYGCTGVFRGRQ